MWYNAHESSGYLVAAPILKQCLFAPFGRKGFVKKMGSISIRKQHGKKTDIACWVAAKSHHWFGRADRGNQLGFLK